MEKPLLMTNLKTGGLTFRRHGDVVNQPGVDYSGKITVVAECGAYQVWKKASGKFCSGRCMPWETAPVWYALMRIEGGQAFPVESGEPGRRARAYLKELTEKMHDLAHRRAAAEELG